MLTARGEDTDRIVGLEMGADDYLSKPFNPELLAKLMPYCSEVMRLNRSTNRKILFRRQEYHSCH